MLILGFVGSVLPVSVPLAFVDVRVFAHATEDADRVLAAVRNLLPAEFVDVVSFRKSVLHGHYGNPIVLFEARIKDRKVVGAVFERLSSGLGVFDKDVLAGEVMQHVDDGNLFVRLDKQSAFLGEFKLGVTDAVHLRFHFRKHLPEDVLDVCRKFGLLP